MKIIYLIDFDGTISYTDSTTLLGHWHNPDLTQKCLNQLRKNEINIREYIQTILENLNITEQQYRKTLHTFMEMDYSFIEFTACGAEFRIVSSGADKNIKYSMELLGYSIPDEWMYTNQLMFKDTKAKLYHPYYDMKNGVNKIAVIEKYRRKGYRIAFIGDGLSDLQCVSYADILFAKRNSVLAQECKRTECSCILFDDFKDIINYHHTNYIKE